MSDNQNTDMRVYCHIALFDAEGGDDGSNGIYYRNVKSPQEAQDVINVIGSFDKFHRERARIPGVSQFGLDVFIDGIWKE